jgi:hypothetical protein
LDTIIVTAHTDVPPVYDPLASTPTSHRHLTNHHTRYNATPPCHHLFHLGRNNHTPPSQPEPEEQSYTSDDDFEGSEFAKWNKEFMVDTETEVAEKEAQ